MLFEHSNFVICIGCSRESATLRGTFRSVHRLPHVGSSASRIRRQLVPRSDRLIARVQEIVDVCVIGLSIASEIHPLRNKTKRIIIAVWWSLSTIRAKA